MAILTTERLLQEIRDGRKVDAEDRRRVLRYLMSVQPDMTNVDLGELFSVSEKVIRNDKKLVREEMRQELEEDDVALVVTDIVFNFRRQLRDLEMSKAKCKPGTKEYRVHCESILGIELKKTAALQELGYLPKNIGNLTVDKYEYAAIVLKGDQVESRPITMFDEKTQQAIRARGQKALPEGSLPTIDGELVESTEREAVIAAPQG